MTSPLVSIITIFLNEEKFLSDAIDSVLAQTYHNFELLLVDDGSTDRSGAIAQRYTRQHPNKIRYLHHPNHQNLGMSATRNLGIAKAQGDYLALLDGDDIWLPHKLEKQISILLAHPEVAMVFSPSKLWYSWTQKEEDRSKDWIETVAPKSDQPIQPPTLLVSSLLKQQIHSASTCSLLVRRSIVNKGNGFENRFKGLFEDQAFLTKIYASEVTYAMSECLDWYRQHPDSCVYTHADKRTKDAARLKFLTWVERYLNQQKIEDPEVWSALHDTVWPYHHPWLHHFQETIVPIGRRLLPARFRDWLWQQWSDRKQPAQGGIHT